MGLEQYDLAIAKIRRDGRAFRERQRTEALQALHRLPAAERERRERELRVKWWVADRMEAIDYQIKRSETATKLAEVQTNAATLRRKEEALTVTDIEAAMSIYRGSLRGAGKTPVRVAARFHRMRVEPGAEEIPHLGALLNKWVRELGLDAKWAATPGTNSYAWPSARRIEGQFPGSEEAFAGDGHEVAHCACPCPPSHARVPLPSGGTVCVECEIRAWVWLIDRLIADGGEWTWAMHCEMGHSLTTYAKYATESQRVEIERMCSRLAFRETQLRRATRDTKG